MGQRPGSLVVQTGGTAQTRGVSSGGAGVDGYAGAAGAGFVDAGKRSQAAVQCTADGTCGGRQGTVESARQDGPATRTDFRRRRADFTDRMRQRSEPLVGAGGVAPQRDCGPAGVRSGTGAVGAALADGEPFAVTAGRPPRG